jgi:hypothetical protein
MVHPAADKNITAIGCCEDKESCQFATAAIANTAQNNRTVQKEI